MEKYFKRKATEQSSTLNPQTPNERRSPKLDPPMKKSWLEYSQSEDAAYCVCYYLMRSHLEEHKGCGDAFITEGFTNWKKSERFRVHLGDVNNSHNQAWRNCQALMKQKQHIEGVLCKQSNQVKEEYRIHLTDIIDCIRYLLAENLAFRGNDESISSRNKGNFLELMNFLVNHNEDIYKVWKTCLILNDLGDDLFAILIDESRDISVNEQMVVVIRYLNNEGKVIERFLGVIHVSNTSALTLKSGLESLFAKYGLSLSRIRGQGYDGAIGASCKRRDIRESQATKVKQTLEHGEISSGHGLNQEMTIKKMEEMKLNNHFTEVNTELLLFVACLSPRDSFSAFDKERLIHLAQFYPSEFSQVELLTLDCQIENYFLDVCSDSEFSKLEGIGDLSIKLVETKKHIVYPLVYLLLKLSLILLVATATTERAFSAMNIIKNRM
ncbi:uncharacterized protein LOC127111582 [Lathyrus oleraceus]|uniref:uncharacterized protein LOC127111582 n=1 Tax=Pisum sativum TaxID=3888 RepID=UPI0021D394CA|nr:uncharacterized protein LOC127111582 [Pisum sativum]